MKIKKTLDAKIGEITQKINMKEHQLDVARRRVNNHLEVEKMLQQLISLECQRKELVDKASLGVTDHAIIRYLERVKGVDMMSVKNDILSFNLVDTINRLGGTGVYVDQEHKVVVEDYKVITIKPA